MLEQREHDEHSIMSRAGKALPAANGVNDTKNRSNSDAVILRGSPLDFASFPLAHSHQISTVEWGLAEETRNAEARREWASGKPQLLSQGPGIFRGFCLIFSLGSGFLSRQRFILINCVL